MKRIASAALLIFLASALFAADAQQQQTYTWIQGTIHAVELKSASCEMVTGVGMSLRLLRLVAPPTAEIESGGEKVPLSALKRGDIVRARCYSSGGQLFADHIVKVAAR